MATKVLSIEIGQGLTNVVEMDFRAKNPKVYNSFTFETPEGVVDDGMVKRSVAFASAMKAECTKRNIKTNQAVFVVNSSRIARRAVKIPLVKENQIQDLVDTGANDFFPVDMNQYHLVYEVTGKETKGEEKGYRLNLLAVPNDLTASYYDFAQSIGCQLAALDYVGNSVHRLAKGVYENGIDVLLKIDEDNTMVTVLKDGNISLQRNIAYGVKEVVEELRRQEFFGENITYAQAIQLLRSKDCLLTDLEAKAEGDEAAAKAQVTAALERLISMLNRVLEYFASHNQGAVIDAITLMGVGADFNGLSQLLANELNNRVRVLQDAELDIVNKQVNGEALYACCYAACYGAAMDPLNLLPVMRRGKRKSETGGENSMIAGLLILLFGVLVAAALIVIPVMQYTEVTAQKEKIEANIRRLEKSGVEEVYEEYITVKQLANRMNEIYNATLSRSEELVAFIEELEDNMPSDLLVLNFTATPYNVSMSIEVNSKEQAAKTLMQLRAFDSIQIVNTAGLTDNLDEEAGTVAFSVECVYKPVEVKEAE